MKNEISFYYIFRLFKKIQGEVMVRWSYSNRELVEDSLILSAKDIKKFVADPDSYAIYSWKSGASMTIKYNSGCNALELSYAISNQNFNEYIPVIQQDCHYGSVRYYFACPNCSCKTYKLYKSPSSKYFTCRKCQNLTYHKQKNHLKSDDPFLYAHYDRLANKLITEGKTKTKKERKKIIKLREKAGKLFNKHYPAMLDRYRKIGIKLDNIMHQTAS